MTGTTPVLRGTMSGIAVLLFAAAAWAAAPVACDQKLQVLSNTASALRPAYSDADTGSGFSFSLVSGPSHGTVVFSGSFPSNSYMTYTPSAGYTGTDSWTWKVNDGSSDSNTVTCSVLVRDRGSRAGRTVLIVVKSTIQPEIQTELDQLRLDIINQGYSAEILPCTAGNAQDLWNFLHTQCYTPGKWVAGAILVGQLPFATNSATDERTDFVYMNLDQYRIVQYCSFNIWVSRIWALSISGSDLLFGDEVTLIRRALLANHEYRTGLSGLPHHTYNIDTAYPGLHPDYAPNALDIWPTVETLEPRYAWPKTGDFMEEQSHGERDGYDDNKVGTWTIHDMLGQIRYAVCCSCKSGYPGGVINQQIFTRRGGNVMSAGATETSYSEMIMMLQNSTVDQNCRGLLVDGDTFGDAFVVYQPFDDVYRLVFYGDLSMRPMESPANAIPVVDTLSAGTTSGVAPLTVDFSAASHDTDGTVDLYEWFPTGHQYGRLDPCVTGTTSVRYIFAKPHTYRARVQVIDNRHAVGYKETDIRVAPKPGQPVRINCGECWNYKFTAQDHYKEGLDWTDSLDKLWLHDQQWQSGTWGWQGPKEANYWSGDILGTADDFIFLSYRWDYGENGITYRIPVANGTYTVNLGFADKGVAAAGERLIDVTAEGVPCLTGYDIYADVGANTAVFKTQSVAVSDGELTLLIETSAGSPNPAIINCIEIIPPAGDNKEPVAKINANPPIGPAPLDVSFTSTGSSDPDGTITAYAWDFGDGATASGASADHTYAAGGVYNAILLVTDSSGGVAADRTTITVTTGGNIPPVADNQLVDVNFNTPEPIALSATDGNGDPLTYIKLSNPAHGTLLGTIPNYTYTPDTGYTGIDSFTWKANDGTDDSNVATFTLNVLPPGSTDTVTLDVVQDTFLREQEPGLGHDENAYGISIDSYSTEVAQGMIQFDLSSVPGGSAITSAMLKLYCWREVGAGAGTDTIQVIRCDSAWVETTANWTNDSTNGSVVYSTVQVPAYPDAGGNMVDPPQLLDFDVTALVQEWVNGTYPNHGMRLNPNDTELDTRWVDGEDTPGKGTAYTPKLVVTYTTGGSDTAPPAIAPESAVFEGTVSDDITCPPTVDVGGTAVPVTVTGLDGTWTSPAVTLSGNPDTIDISASDGTNTRTVTIQISY
ncbi:MAG: DNRLRE domain-containing protein [Planctomycetes bacterium]|nr:DNRLRE domain-containing protein [Planctomycetota bacterium]